MRHIICAICGKNQQIQKIFDANFTLEDIDKLIFSARRLPDKIHYQLNKCKNCGLIFSSPIFSASKIKHLYAQSVCVYDKQIPYLAKTYLKLYEHVEKKLPKDPKVLEIGAGNGFFLDSLYKEKKVTKLYGVEPGKKMVKESQNGIKKHIIVDVFKKGLFKANTFDLVCCFHTLDHVTDPAEVIQESLNVLKKGGMALFVVHDTDGISVKVFCEKSPIFDIEHIYLFNKDNLRKIFKNNGFKVLKISELKNTYPLWYWWQMTGIPKHVKELGLNLLKKTTLSNKTFTFPGGNQYIIARKV